MRDRTQPKKETPKFNPTQWINGHREFVDWWKEHRESGYAENKEGKSRYGIEPWKAYYVERYRAEYSGWSERYSQEEIAAMREEQRKVEAKTAELEMFLGKEFWNKMTPQQFIANVKMATQEFIAEKGGMGDEMEKAYAYEPGQSAEETELLRRRRGDE